MNQKQLNQEWAEIVDLAKYNVYLDAWLKAREIVFSSGGPTDSFTNALRKKYRKIMSGQFSEAA